MQIGQIQKRQLDWNGGGRIYHFDHLALSSDISAEHRASGEESSSSSEEDLDPVHSTKLSKSGLPGDPGIDYPILPSIPLTDFHCRGRTPGFYGDTQTACQVSSLSLKTKKLFLLFSQLKREDFIVVIG